MRLPDFDTDLFLRDYWQKKPLLIRNPWARVANPLDPDELAGLACEAEVESRLVMQTARRLAGRARPVRRSALRRTGRARRGPCSSRRSIIMCPRSPRLIEPFRFVPNWRIDDVMVSYADDGGGVGPHFDQYDVFLIQGLGTRRWRIGGRCDAGQRAAAARRPAPARRLRGAGRMAARARRHPLCPARHRARRRRGRRRLHDLFDRLPRALARRTGRRIIASICSTPSPTTTATPIPDLRPQANPGEISSRGARQAARDGHRSDVRPRRLRALVRRI